MYIIFKSFDKFDLKLWATKHCYWATIFENGSPLGNYRYKVSGKAWFYHGFVLYFSCDGKSAENYDFVTKLTFCMNLII